MKEKFSWWKKTSYDGGKKLPETNGKSGRKLPIIVEENFLTVEENFLYLFHIKSTIYCVHIKSHKYNMYNISAISMLFIILFLFTNFSTVRKTSYCYYT